MQKTKHPALKNACWIVLLLAAAGFIICGCAPDFGRNEWQLVLDKAINVCFQCIGLG